MNSKHKTKHKTKLMKNFLKILFSIFVVILLYLLAWPVDIEPAAYIPPPNPRLKGVFEKNDQLQSTKKLLEGKGIGPEGIAISADSFLYTGYADGRIVKFSMDGNQVSEFTKTDGRPLGMQFDTSGNLIVADEYLGLLSINPRGKIEVLTDEVDGTKIFFADDLDIASNGVIYFTDASQRNHNIEKEVWELQPTGRLISYNPSTKETKIELSNLLFANGVAISPDGDYLLVNETMGMVINKYWLKGTKKGKKEIFINELPGYPDNITFSGGIFWLAMPSIRDNQQFEDMYEKPFIRKVVKRPPASMLKIEEAAPHGIIIGINLEGKIVHNFQDTTGVFHHLTSAIEFDGKLYLGSLEMDAVGLFDLGGGS